ncbi:MAG: hypothetical protein U5L00_01715 [Desulfovermiculus sp.]|nr:hypothetical protein [Desulfovermiculus sp.]
MELQTTTSLPSSATNVPILGAIKEFVPGKRYRLMSGAYRQPDTRYTTDLDDSEYEGKSSKYIETVEHIRILHGFVTKMLMDAKDLDPVIAREINEKLWDVI